MNNAKTRAGLMAIAGLYMFYIAYQLIQGRNDPDTTMTPALFVIFIILFIAAGLGVLFYAWRIWKHRDDGKDEKPPEDMNSLK